MPFLHVSSGHLVSGGMLPSGAIGSERAGRGEVCPLSGANEEPGR